jgi:drug/metabolite transporter (DMT)-like permease
VIPAVLLASALGVIANQIMFAEGMARTLPSHAAVINSQIPLLTLCFAVLARQERFTFAKVLGIVIAISGVLILLRIDELVEGGVPDRRMLLGDLLVLGNATTFSAFLVLMRRIGRDIDPLRATAIGFVFGTVVIGCYSATALSHEGLATLASMPVLPYALFAVLGATVLSYLLNNWALHHTHSSQVALYICLQPVVTTAVSIVQDGHRPEPRFYVAGTLACSGVVVQHVVAAFARRGAAQK